MDRHDNQQLKWLERRSRLLTGTILGVLALAACYGLMFFGARTSPSARQHFYAWMVAVLFYFAGDLLAFVWFKVVCIRLEMMLNDFKQSLRQQLVNEQAEEETLSAADVEIVRPSEHSS